MTQETLRKANELEAQLYVLRKICGTDNTEDLDLERHSFEINGIRVPTALNEDILKVIIKHRDKLQKEFEEL